MFTIKITIFTNRRDLFEEYCGFEKSKEIACWD